jgi:copper chaperone
METTALVKIKRMKDLLKVISLFLVMFVTVSCSQQEENINQTAMADQEVQAVTIPVEGMSCGSCVSTVKRTVKAIDGVKQIEVSLEKRQATIIYNKDKVSAQTIQEAINDIGYKAGKPVEVKQQ